MILYLYMVNFEEINKYGVVFLTNLYEPKTNQLLLEVKKSKTSAFEVSVPVGDILLSGCKEVSIDNDDSFFTILFTDYISYYVVNESFANSDSSEDYTAGEYSTFCIFHRSNYMQFILKETFADEMFPNELKHYGLFASDHIVHIISRSAPAISVKESVNQG